MPQANGRPPTKEAKKLIRKDFSEQVMSLGEERMINRQFLRQAVGEFDPEFIPLERLYQMRKDPMIQMGLHYRKFPLIRTKWHIECKDPAIKAALEDIIGKVYGPYTRAMLNKFDFGYQGMIKQFELGTIDAEYEDEKSGAVRPAWDKESNVQPMVLGRPLPLPPDFTSARLEKGQFKGIDTALGVQSTPSGNNDDKFVPAEYALWAVNEFEENFRNYYGYPLTGYAYRYWWSSWFRHHMEDRHFEMDADPALQVWFPPGTSPDPDTGEPKANRLIALEIGAALRGGATIAMPSDVFIDEQGRQTTTKKWEAAFLQGGENLEAFRASADYLNVMKLRACLVPEQALIEGQGATSSRNVAATYSDIFFESLGQEADDLDDTWNDYIIPQLVEANWGADAPSARKKTTGFESEDTELLGELVKAAFTLDPNALPVNWKELLTKTNVPQLTVKEQKEREQELQEAQDEAAKAAQTQIAVPGGPPAPPTNGQGPPQNVAPPPPQGQRLSLGHGKAVPSTAPDWARRAHDRRQRSVEALSERLRQELEARYQQNVESAANYIEKNGTSQGFSLAFGDRRRVKAVKSLLDRMTGHVKHEARRYNNRIRGEVANMYHASGASELVRLGQEMVGWDVGRQDIQQWADAVADEILEQSDESMIELHIRPFLEGRMEDISYTFEPEEAMSLAQELREAMADRPGWMSLRTARTEARKAYNNAHADVWELSGISHCRMYDGLGGLSGMTDEVCLARNGKIVTLAEFRKEDAEEHPNGTLGAVPLIDDTVHIIQLSSSPIVSEPVSGESSFSVDPEGVIALVV